jgi:hypothetical protein
MQIEQQRDRRPKWENGKNKKRSIDEIKVESCALLLNSLNTEK